MGTTGWVRFLGLGLVLALAASCTGSAESAETAQATTTPQAQTAEEWCAAGADRVIERLEDFLGDLPDISAQEFLAQEEIDGLAPFQNDVAQIIAETTDQSSTLCDLDGLQDLVGQRINDVERDGVLAELLIATIRDGRELSTVDLAVRPGDDVESVLGLLDDGSTLTFAPGTYELQRPLLVTRSISLIGESAETTTIASTSGDAAIVVVGRGELIMRDLEVTHIGDAVASVILSFNRPVDLNQVALAGGVADENGGAGNGLVLTDETFGPPAAENAEKPRSVVANVVITDNAGAGIAVSGALDPRVEGAEIANNGVCGICFFGGASGEVVDSTIRENDFGLQIGDQASPRISANMISESSTAGIVVLGTAAPVIDANIVESNAEVAVALQEASSPVLSSNMFRNNPFGVSVLSTGDVVIRDNDFVGGEIGLQVDESSAPQVEGNRLSGTTSVGIAITAQSMGQYVNNDIAPEDGIGVVVDGAGAPTIDGLVVRGGAVGVAYTSTAGGTLTNGTLADLDIGIQLDEESDPTISNLEITNLISAGVVARGSSMAELINVRVGEVGEVGFALADTTDVVLDGVELVGSQTGISIIGMSTATVRNSSVSDTEVGVQVGENANPTLIDNAVIDARSAAFVFVGESTGVAMGNQVRDPGIVGFQIGDTAAPEIDANVLFLSQPEEASSDPAEEASEDPTQPDAEGPAETPESDPEEGAEETPESDPEGGAEETPEDAPESDSEEGAEDAPESDPEAGVEGVEEPAVELAATVGILYAGESSGTASKNQIIGFIIGVQASESSSPEIVENTIDGGVLLGVGILFRDDARGSASDNETSAHAVGLQVGGNATPTIDANTVLTASNVAFLVQENAAPVLTGNTCPDGPAGIAMLDGTDPERSDNTCTEVLG